MTPSFIIREALSEGVNLTLSPSGTIKATGQPAEVNRWLPLIREHKAGIVAALQEAANPPEPVFDQARPADEQAIRRWLVSISERDPAIIVDVLTQCRHDEEVRAYFLGRAAESAAGARTDRMVAKLKRDSGLRYAIETHTEADPEAVILTLAIRGKGACELRIPKSRYDAFAMLTLIKQHTTRETLQ